MDLPTPHEVLCVRPEETVATFAAELAVAACLDGYWEDEISTKVLDVGGAFVAECSDLSFDLDLYVASLRAHPSGDHRWIDQLGLAFAGIPRARLAVWLTDNCVFSDLVEDECLIGGSTHRRLNAILDVADLGFCASEAQNAFVSFNEGVSAAKLTWMHQAGGMGIAGAAGFAGGWLFMPFLGGLGQKAADYFLNEASKSDELSEQAARLLLAAMASAEDEQDSSVATAIWSSLYDHNVQAAARLAERRKSTSNVYTGSGAAADQRVREISSAMEFLNGLLKDVWDLTPAEDVPQVRNLTLPAAEALLGALGYRSQRMAVDGGWIMNPQNWIVERQQPDTGRPKSAVTLHVRKA